MYISSYWKTNHRANSSSCNWSCTLSIKIQREIIKFRSLLNDCTTYPYVHQSYPAKTNRGQYFWWQFSHYSTFGKHSTVLYPVIRIYRYILTYLCILSIASHITKLRWNYVRHQNTRTRLSVISPCSPLSKCLHGWVANNIIIVRGAHCTVGIGNIITLQRQGFSMKFAVIGFVNRTRWGRDEKNYSREIIPQDRLRFNGFKNSILLY